MRVLALNPYHGGSHRAFLDGWIAHSQHAFEVLTLPPHHWKWRMRHGAITLVDQLAARNDLPAFDVLWCTDMLDLAQFIGLARAARVPLPGACICYFHENQLTYPDTHRGERDVHFALTNLTSALAADAVWFNSAYHLNTFCDAMTDLLNRMPDHASPQWVDTIRAKSSVQHPGITPCQFRTPYSAPRTPLTIAWVSRWEHDKDPDTFFAALALAEQRGIDFRLNILGESFKDVPPCFAAARKRFADRIHHWGYAASREQYVQRLTESDVVVSSAKHEFFGIAILEAVEARCVPLVPRALAYPETLGSSAIFHDGTPGDICQKLHELAQADMPGVLPDVSRYHWPVRAAAMDECLLSLCEA